MDAGGGNSFPAERGDTGGLLRMCPGSAFLEFGSTTIKLYLPKSASLSGNARETPQRAAVEEVRIPWNLGRDVFQTGRIRPETIDRCVCVLRSLQLRLPDVDFRSVPAVGTAALREAANAASLQEAVRQALDLEIHVIDGAIEAFLLETGFRDAVEQFPTALFDLGGGSLEIVQYLAADSTGTLSLPLGAIRLHCSLEHIRDRIAYAEEGRQLATASIRRFLNGHTVPYRAVVGTGGTVRSIARLVGDDTLTSVDLARLIRRALDDDLGDEVEPHRRDVFLAGLLIVESLFATLDLKRIHYRSASVKRGLIDLMRATPRRGSVAS